MKFRLFENTYNLVESSLSRILSKTTEYNTFAIIGSRDKDTHKDRLNELTAELSVLQHKKEYKENILIGYEMLRGSYTYENGEHDYEYSYLITNIFLDEALKIAGKINQESIIWKDSDLFCCIDLNKNILFNLKPGDITFDPIITAENGSTRIKSPEDKDIKTPFAFKVK